MTTELPFANTIAGSIKGAMQAAGAKSRDLWMMPLATLRKREGFNVRVDNDEHKARVREIADSIKVNGYYSDKPLSVMVIREDGVDYGYITDGHTRFDGAMLAVSEGAEMELVPVVPSPAGTTLEDITIGLVTKNSGRPLQPFEVGIVCKRLIDMGLEDKEIANRIGLGLGYVRNLLSLVGAPKAIRDLVTSGQVSASLAVETMHKEGAGAVKVLKDAGAVAKELGKSKVTKKSVKKVTAPAKNQSTKQKKAKVDTTPTPAAVESPAPPQEVDLLVKALTSALSAVTKSPVWDTMSASTQKIVVDAFDAGTDYLHGDAPAEESEL